MGNKNPRDNLFDQTWSFSSGNVNPVSFLHLSIWKQIFVEHIFYFSNAEGNNNDNKKIKVRVQQKFEYESAIYSNVSLWKSKVALWLHIEAKHWHAGETQRKDTVGEADVEFDVDVPIDVIVTIAVDVDADECKSSTELLYSLRESSDLPFSLQHLSINPLIINSKRCKYPIKELLYSFWSWFIISVSVVWWQETGIYLWPVSYWTMTNRLNNATEDLNSSKEYWGFIFCFLDMILHTYLWIFLRNQGMKYRILHDPAGYENNRGARFEGNRNGCGGIFTTRNIRDSFDCITTIRSIFHG